MNFIDKITGNDMKRVMSAMETRVKTLPKDYQEAWLELQTHLWEYSDLTGRNLIPVLENILTLLEETAAEHLPIADVFGNDYPSFIEELLGKGTSHSTRDKWRQQLQDNVQKKLAQLERK